MPTEAPFEEEVSVPRQEATVERVASADPASPECDSEGHHPMTRTIVVLFDTVAEAEQAAQHLALDVGGVRGEVYGPSREGELHLLPLLPVPADDAALQEHMRRGGAVLHAEVPDDRFGVVADALKAAGAADFDEREAVWRREGWTGASATFEEEVSVSHQEAIVERVASADPEPALNPTESDAGARR
jgi:hypothetical protein